jgi:hypothetical protein
MVNLLKNNSTIGLYITEDNGNKITGDTPEDLDLDLVGTVGVNWIHFENIVRFEEKATANMEGEFTGWKTWQIDAASGTAASTGGARRVFFMITVECNETTAENFKKFFTLNVKIGDTLKYLIKQTASSSFEQFSNNVASMHPWAAVIIRGYDIVEMANSGKDLKLINIACEEILTRN